LDKLTSARIERRHWRTDEHDYRGHFNWAKAVDGPAGLTHEWIASVS
jgi:hypothetical protein